MYSSVCQRRLHRRPSCRAQHTDPFSYGCAVWVLLGQQLPARFQLSGERKRELLTGTRYHEPSMVIEAVIPGKFLARTALIQRSTREQAARIERVAMRESLGGGAPLDVRGRLGAARGLSLAGNPTLDLTLSLDAHDRDGP